MSFNTLSVAAARKGCLIQGVGYIIPDRSVLYDGFGNRLKRVSDVTRSVVKGSAGIGMSAQDVRRRVYHDPPIMCDEKELQDFDLVGKPLCINHDATHKVGEIVNASVHEGKLLITASVTDPHWAKKIADDNFDLKSFSVSYSVKLEGDEVVSKRFTEISMVDEPYYDNCDLEIYASDTATSDMLRIFGDARGTTLNICASEAGTTNTVPAPPENAMDTEDYSTTTTSATANDGGMAQETNDQNERADEPMIQEDEGIDGDNPFSSDKPTNANLSVQELQSQLEMMRRRDEEKQRLLDELMPKAQRFQEEREKLADSLTKNFIEFNGGLSEENRAEAEKFATTMRKFAKEDDGNSLEFIAKSLQNARQSQAAHSPFANSQQQKTLPAVKRTQASDTQHHKTATAAPQRTAPRASPSSSSTTTTRPNATTSTSGPHRPVADWSSGQTKNVPSQSGVKRSVLSDLYPDEGKRQKSSSVAIAAGKNTENSRADDPQNIVHMSPAFTDLWTKAMVLPILDRSAGSGDLFNRKAPTSTFGFNNGGNSLTVSASRAAYGEIADHAGGRGIMPTLVGCNKPLSMSHDVVSRRNKLMNDFFPDNVHQDTLPERLGGALDWNRSLHLFEDSDESMRRVVENPERGGDFEVVGMYGELAIAASKQPVGLNIAGSAMETAIAKAKTVPYFSNYTDAQMKTLATMANANYSSFYSQQQTVNT